VSPCATLLGPPESKIECECPQTPLLFIVINPDPRIIFLLLL